MYGDLLNTIGFVETADPEVGEAMELRYFRRREPCVGAVAKRLYAGQYRRHQHGGRQSEL